MLRFFKDLEVFMILEEKIYFFNNFFSNEIVWTGEVWISTVDAYSEMEFCMPIWLNHDHGDGGFVDIPPIFLIQKLFSKKFITQMDTSFNKAQHKQELLCG
jgi:hypothetical protein